MTYEGEHFLARLIDLPCIIESQKTLDKKQFHKVADICQMIQIERPTMPLPPDPLQVSILIFYFWIAVCYNLVTC
jgi:TATA-binding protein-associated factor Taf7